MKRLMVLMALLTMLTACQSDEGGVYINPTFTDPTLGADKAIEKIAVFSFTSAFHEADDPDGLATQLMNRHFIPALDARVGYAFISPGTVEYAISREGWEAEAKEFLDAYAKSNQTEVAFLTKLAEALKCDAFMLPVIDLWQQDTADRRENASSATYVGATITIVDAKNVPGDVLFRSSIEEYLEAARTETADRGATSLAGSVRSDRGAKLFRAPPFEDVVTRVIEQLIASLPER